MRKKKSENGKIKNIFQKYRMLFLVMAVVAVSGCIVPGGDVFAGMFSPQRPATTEASADLITTQNLNIIPNPPISADNGFTVSFEVKNNDENEEVKNVLVNYYDTGLCKPGKAPTGGGGVGGLIDAETDVRVAHFDTTCNSQTKTIHIVDTTDQNKEGYTFVQDDQKLCNNKDCQVEGCQVNVYNKDSEAGTPKASIKIGNGNVISFDLMNQEKSYTYTSFAGLSYTINIKYIGNSFNVKKSRCVSSATSCARTSSDADTVCKKLGSIYYVGDISDTSHCYPWFTQPTPPGYSGFDGYCFKCDYTSGTSGGTTPPVAGAKTYFPLQTELKEWEFTAPTNSQIGNMPQTCGIKYKITYDFTAKTQTDVTVISKSKMAELQRAGQEPSASPSQSVGVGPIKIFFDFGAKQPIKSGDVLPVFITIEDKGSGVYGKVLSGKLKIKMPSGFELATPDSCSKFGKSGGVFTNSAEIPMIKKSSPQLRCSFKMPSVADMKTFYITGELAYEYKFDDEIKVSINPTLVR